MEKLQYTTKELGANLQEVKQSTSKVDVEGLRAEIQKLKESLEEAKEQLKVSGETQAHTAPPLFQPSLSTPTRLHLVAPRVPSTLLNSRL